MRYFIHAICSVFIISGCGEKMSEEPGKSVPNNSHRHGEEEGAGADFVTGKGIILLDDTKRSIGLELMEVGEKNMTDSISLTAQVYRGAGEQSRKHSGERSGMAYASARCPAQVASQLRPGQTVLFNSADHADKSYAGKIWKILGTTSPDSREAEILLELADPGKSLSIGAFVEASIPSSIQSKPVISIPRSALLKTAQGVYVFVENGGYLLRTEVQTGIEHAGDIEITRGLYEGDVIAAQPVETLYMIELRSTKGGGHSH